jgi:hypothetical protein
MTNDLRFIWTRRAVERFIASGSADPRHTVSNVTADLDSPWLEDDWGRRANGSPWILVNQHGKIEAEGNLR